MSILKSAVRSNMRRMELIICRRFQVNDYIQHVFKNVIPFYGSEMSAIELKAVVKVIKILPHHIKICIFEHLPLSHLIEMLKIDSNVFNNVETIEIVKPIILSHLGELLQGDWIEEYSLEDILGFFQLLYSRKKLMISIRPLLGDINKVNNLEEFIKVLLVNPLIVLDIIYDCLFIERSRLELHIELLFKILAQSVHPENRAQRWFVEKIFGQALLITAKSNNIRMLNYLMEVRCEKIYCISGFWFWKLVLDNHSRDYIKRLLEIMFGFYNVTSATKFAARSVLSQIILALIKVSDFEFVKEVITLIPDYLKEDNLIVMSLRNYISEIEAQDVLEDYLMDVYRVLRFLLELGFYDVE